VVWGIRPRAPPAPGRLAVHRRPAPLITAVLALAVVLAAARHGPRPPHRGIGSAATHRSPRAAYKDIKTRFRNLTQWRKTSVDTRLMVGKGYAPGDLVSVRRANIAGSGKVRALMIDDLRAMARARSARARRSRCGRRYRSYQHRWRPRLLGRVSGRKAALKASARPGHSEHQLGTTIDVRSASSTRAPWDYTDWAKTGPGGWMKTNAWKYGFVMSYPKGKQRVTCYTYEPWHYRYVGKAMAERIHDSGLTTREYLWRHHESVP